MRRLLKEMDRGQGLRMVLRAAAALEAGDDATVARLLPKVRVEQPRWRLPLQLASVCDAERAHRWRALAERKGAPVWALAWFDAVAGETRRDALVTLLFVDRSLAMTVAHKELDIPGAEADAASSKRYVSFAHGRDCIRRFGADAVATLLERAHESTGAA
jgi:hypothetical protein